MILYENPNLKVEQIDGQKIMIQHWDGYASSENFRKGIDKSVELVFDKKIRGIISDARTQAVVRPDDAKYAAGAMPKLITAGIKAMAFVVPESVFTQMSLDKFKTTSLEKTRTRYFDRFTEAEQWVKEVLSQN